MGLANKLSFARDRLMESFFWSVGMVPQPQYDKCRIGLTKVVKLLTLLDDIYDVYASLEELHQFTDAVEKYVLASAIIIIFFIIIYKVHMWYNYIG